MNAPITLHLGTREGEQSVRVRAFVEAIEATTIILRELDRTLFEGKFEWYFTKLEIGSGIAILAGSWTGEKTDGVPPESIESASQLIATRFVEGLSTLESRVEWPSDFTLTALSAARLLVAVRGDGITSITVSTPGMTPASLSLQVDRHVQEILGHRYAVLGSVEGIVETISLKGSPFFCVRERVSRKSIKCSFGRSHLPDVRNALGRHALVYGLLSYSEYGGLLSVSTVDSLTLLDEAESTPVDQILGIAPDFTDGMTSDQFIEWIHDDVEP
jgi:hypothetical protein